MAQPIRPEEWSRAVRENNPDLLPNKRTKDIFKGNGGIKINPNGGICRLWDIIYSDYITDYDPRRRNGLSGDNTEGRDGWGASDYGVFQTVRFVSTAFGMSRHRSVAYRFEHQPNFAGDLGYYGDATTSSYTHGGEDMLLDIAAQINEVKKHVEENVIGPDQDNYNMAMACNGKISARVVCKPGYVDKIFDGDPAHFDWVAEPGIVTGTPLPPRFAPIQCMELDFANIYPALTNLRSAWNACNIDHRKCMICIDPDYKTPIMQILTGKGIPVLESTKQMMQDGIEGDEFKLNGFTFNFNIDPDTYPYVYVDANNNVVHSANGQASYDKYINSYTPQAGDKNIMRKRMIASYRTGVNNFVRTEWDDTNATFVKKLINYPLGQAKNKDFYGQPTEVPWANLDATKAYPFDSIGGGIGLPAADEVPEGWTGMVATGPITPITKRKVVGLAIYPEAVALSAEYEKMVTDEGLTRGDFTEVCWGFKYDCWVLPQLSAGVVPILDINDDVDFSIPVSVKGDVTVKNAQVEQGGSMVDKALKVEGTVSPATGADFDVTVSNTGFDAHVTNTDADPVKTKEVTAANRKAKK